MYSRYVPNKLLIAHKSRLLFTYNADSIRDLTSLQDSIGRRLHLNFCTQQANCTE